MNDNKILKYIDILIFNDEVMDENTIDDIIKRITSVLNNRRYKNMLNMADNNWLEIPTDKVIKSVLEYFENLKKIEVYI